MTQAEPIDHAPSDSRPWWETAVIYQIYPRSFQDSDSDGIGDLAGIINRLDYLVWLGVEAIWISPVFRSPMADFGYDVADYCDVDPIFGTLSDLEALVAAAHRKGLRVLLDFVPNHTSDQHPWFEESRSSRDNARRDWYLWADPTAEGGPPNNWLSMFGGPAWTWDEQTGQYYGHSFLKEQPDLNWRHPRVREAMYDALRFWLERGIDGFRVDVMWLLIKDAQLRDNPPNPEWRESARRTYDMLLPVYTADRPEVHEIVADMRGVLDEYQDRVLIGEIYLPVDRLMAYYGSHPQRLGAHLPFNFQLLLLPWRADLVGEAIAAYEAALPSHGWPNWVLGNHDQPRVATRVGPAQARVAAMMLLTLRGTPTLYYGDELGMTDVEIPRDQEQDPARLAGSSRGRDPHRTPMRWDTAHRAGFTSGDPWLPIGPEIESISVAAQRDDASSMLVLHRDLIALRRRESALKEGLWAPIAATGDLLAYERSVPGRRLVVALNMGPGEVTFRSPIDGGRVLLSTISGDTPGVGHEVRLRPNEGVIIGP